MTDPLRVRLAEELTKYGIQHDGPDAMGVNALEGLLRHIYGNRDMALHLRKLVADIAKRALEIAVPDEEARNSIRMQAASDIGNEEASHDQG